MRRFLLQCSIFWIIFSSLYLLVVYLVTADKDSTFKASHKTNVLFLGNSHIECSVNDSIIGNSLNFARSGERMEWVYAKLRLIKDSNPQIDTVVIGFDNVLCFKNAKTEDTHMGHYSPYFMRYTSFSDIIAILFYASDKYNFDMYTKALNISKLYEIYRESGRGVDALSMGGFVPSYRDKLNDDIKIRGNQPNKDIHFDKLSHYYLDKVVGFCRENSMSLIFMCAPQHELSPLDKKIFKAIHSQYYSQIDFLNYQDLKLPDNAFQDMDHLNASGAALFSEKIKSNL